MQYHLRKNHNAHAGDDERKINYEWPNEKDISGSQIQYIHITKPELACIN